MNIYQDKRIIANYRKMSPQKSFKMGANLINFSLRMFYDSIKAEKPRSSDKKIMKIMRGLLRHEK